MDGNFTRMKLKLNREGGEKEEQDEKHTLELQAIRQKYFMTIERTGNRTCS